MDRTQRGGVSRVLGKLDKAIEEGTSNLPYIIFSLYRSKEIYAGAQKLISKDQETSTADLGLLILDTLEKRGTDAIGDIGGNIKLWTERLSSIIAQLNATVVERKHKS